MLDLRGNNIHAWFNDQQIWVKGFAFQNEILLKEETLLKVFLNVDNRVDFLEVLESLNGMFAIVIWREHFQAAASDLINAFPLFYSNQSKLKIGDQIDFSIDFPEGRKAAPLNTTALNSFISGGFTLNNETLHQDWFRLQAGQFLWKEDGVFQVHFWQHLFKTTLSQESPNLDFSQITDAVFQRGMELAQDQPIIIPLSGGYDSRFILAKLHQMGRPNLICVTYGRKESFEYEIAKKVTDQLQIEWHFVEFNETLFSDYFGPSYQKYQKSAFNYSNLALEQDWLALNHLQKQNLLPKNGMVFSGFGADVLAGSWIPKKTQLDKIKNFNLSSLLDYIVKNPKFFKTNNPFYNEEQFKEAAFYYLANFKINSKTDWLNALHNWGIEHRLSRYHVNGVRAFENLGYQWCLPFFDKDYIAYWANFDWEQKIDKAHYLSFLEEELFEPLKINFHNKSSLHNRPHNSLLTSLKLNTPSILKKILKPLFVQNAKIDVLNLETLSEMIYAQLSPKNKDLFKENRTDLNLIETVHLLEKSACL